MRINRYLSLMGVCSKKQADRLILEHKLFVDDEPAYLGMSVDSTNKVSVDGKLITEKPSSVFLLYNKPVGVVCTHDDSVENNIENAIDYPQRVFAVGRLDKDSEGLLLLTNQGEVVNRLMRSENKHSKVYSVWVDKPITNNFLQKMSRGVEILDTVTLPCEVNALDACCFQITLVQGLNRQIRRMCKALGYKVERLQRTHILDFDLNSIEPGDWRELTVNEVKYLLESIGLSEDETES